MIDALLGGTLAKDPEARTTKTGNAYALATLRVPAGADAVHFVRCMAFDAVPRDELMALGKGDSVCLTGPVELGIWQGDSGPRVSVSVIVHSVVSAYHVKKRRAEVANAQTAHEARGEAKRTNGAGNGRAREQRQRTPALADSFGDVAF